MPRKFFFFFLFIMFFASQLSFSQFTAYGSAIGTSGSCYQLTPAINNQVGTIWYNTQVDLSKSFALNFNVNFGSVDGNGADGLAFVLHTDLNTFQGFLAGGSGCGYSGISPSLDIEFDTFQSTSFGDPGADHIAIQKDGQPDHNTTNTLVAPVQASLLFGNVEDGQYHKVRITWNAVSHNLKVYFDCIQRVSYTADIVNTIFNGISNVYWGYTASTGMLNNDQRVCIDYISFAQYLRDTTICSGQPVMYTLPNSVGFSYNWFPSAGVNQINSYTAVVTPSVTTTYTVDITDICGFHTIDSVKVIVNQLPQLSPIPNTGICSGGQVTLSTTILNAVNGPYDYSWQPTGDVTASIQTSPPTTTSYSLLVTDINSCTSIVTTTVYNNGTPILSLLNVSNSTCFAANNGSATVFVNSGGTAPYSYWWSNGVSTSSISNLIPGIVYTCTVSDASQCVATQTLLVTEPAPPVVTFSASTTEGCEELCVDFVNTSSNIALSSWLLDGATTLSGNLVQHCFQSGIYDVALTVTDANGCTNTVSQANYILVHPKPIPDFSANPFTASILNPTISFIDQSLGASSWLWNFGDQAASSSTEANPGFSFPDTGVFKITLLVSTNFGCDSSVTKEITITSDFDFYAPNSFTPNNDDKNDVFYPLISGFLKDSYLLMIFDRWGEKVFETSNFQLGWNGKKYNRLELMPLGVYVWKVEFSDSSGQGHTHTGKITLLR